MTKCGELAGGSRSAFYATVALLTSGVILVPAHRLRYISGRTCALGMGGSALVTGAVDSVLQNRSASPGPMQELQRHQTFGSLLAEVWNAVASSHPDLVDGISVEWMMDDLKNWVIQGDDRDTSDGHHAYNSAEVLKFSSETHYRCWTRADVARLEGEEAKKMCEHQLTYDLAVLKSSTVEEFFLNFVPELKAGGWQPVPQTEGSKMVKFQRKDSSGDGHTVEFSKTGSLVPRMKVWLDGKWETVVVIRRLRQEGPDCLGDAVRKALK